MNAMNAKVQWTNRPTDGAQVATVGPFQLMAYSRGGAKAEATIKGFRAYAVTGSDLETVKQELIDQLAKDVEAAYESLTGSSDETTTPTETTTTTTTPGPKSPTTTAAPSGMTGTTTTPTQSGGSSSGAK